MQPQSLDGHMGREVEIELCDPCQSIWFDARENLQLTPGAALSKTSDCAHCGSPLSMLDMQQAERLVAQLRDAARTDKVVDPALPLALARARREAEQAFQGIPDHASWNLETQTLGLVGAGLNQLIRLLKK